MNIKEFVEEIEGLYGKYNDFQKKHIYAFLPKYEEILGKLLKYTVDNVSWTFAKRPPGIYEFKGGIAEILKQPSPYKQLQIDEECVDPKDAIKILTDLKNKVIAKNKSTIDFTARKRELDRQANEILEDQ